MRTRPNALFAFALAATLAGCGNRAQLTPKANASLPPAAIGQDTPSQADELLEPDDQARPARNDEILRRSERRRNDRFDLPPPG